MSTNWTIPITHNIGILKGNRLVATMTNPSFLLVVVLFCMLMVSKTVCSYGRGDDMYSNLEDLGDLGDLSAVVRSSAGTYRPATAEGSAGGTPITEWKWFAMKRDENNLKRNKKKKKNDEGTSQSAPIHSEHLAKRTGEGASYRVPNSPDFAALDLQFVDGGARISNPSDKASFSYSLSFDDKTQHVKNTIPPGLGHLISFHGDANDVDWEIHTVTRPVSTNKKSERIPHFGLRGTT
jgi:hypothetical protein